MRQLDCAASSIAARVRALIAPPPRVVTKPAAEMTRGMPIADIAQSYRRPALPRGPRTVTLAGCSLSTTAVSPRTRSSCGSCWPNSDSTTRPSTCRSIRKPAWYAEVHPFNLIPTLIDGDFKVTESNTALRYLADREGRDDLYPRDAMRRARVDMLLDSLSLEVRPALWAAEEPVIYGRPTDVDWRPDLDARAGRLRVAAGRRGLRDRRLLDRRRRDRRPHAGHPQAAGRPDEVPAARSRAGADDGPPGVPGGDLIRRRG